MFRSRLAAAVALLLCLFLAAPSYSDEFFEPQESDPPFDPEAVAACFQLFDGFSTDSVSVAFSRVFNVFVSSSVQTHWSNADVADFVFRVMDDDSTNTADVFPMIWDYFCFSDADPRYSKVNFLGGYTKINIYLYYRNDFYVGTPCGPASDCKDSYFCRDYAFYDRPTALYLPMKERTPEEVANFGFAHEFQHLCYEANGLQWPYRDYTNIDETLSTYAEHMRFAFEWSVNYDYDQSFDSSIYSVDRCEPSGEYNVWRLWTGYLRDHTAGPTSDATDDAVYRWVRAQVSGESEVSMNTLADVLADSDYEWLGGNGGDERLRSLFEYFAVAKFANAPDFGTDNRFGYENGFSPVEHGGFFQDLCTYFCNPQSPVPDLPVDCFPNAVCDTAGCWNVRILPPEYTLGQGQENSMTTESGIYIAPDGSRDYIQVPTYGTDYLIFRAGNYFQDSEQHDLRIALDGAQSTPPTNCQVKVWVLGYDSDVSMLPQHPEDIVFIEPVPVPTTGTSADIVVTDFGRSIKSVVVVVTLVETTASTTYESPGVSNMKYFNYSYAYGVYSPSGANVTWEGTAFVPADRTVPASKTLTVSPGTVVRIAQTDASSGGADTLRVELNVEGTLVADGTAASPIRFESWTPTTSEDWVGFYFDSQSGGGTFDHCNISRAEYAIESYVPLTVTNTEIEDCRYAGVVSQAGGALIESCALTDLGSYGIFLTTDTTVVRNTTVDNAGGTAFHVQSNAATTVRGSSFLNSDKGFYHSGSTNFVDIDSSCVFNGNAIGVHFYQTAWGSNLRNSTINSNTSTGVVCDASHPVIRWNTIRYNNTAISCTNVASPLIQENAIRNSTIGIMAGFDAEPNIGVYPTTGGNTIAFSSGYHVKNYHVGYLVKAENNCWNMQEEDSTNCMPKAGKIYGSVDTDHANCCEVSQSALVQIIPTPTPEKTSVTGLTAIVPNPFNPTTTIHYGLALQTTVEIRIYDVVGRFVRELVSGTKVAGNHAAVWDGTDRRGAQVASGVYFVKMAVGRDVFTKKMVLLK
jgi:hypothetical protein